MAAVVGGLTAELTVWSAPASPAVKPYPNGEGRGVFERLVKAGLGMALVEIGREPMGPTDPMGPVMGLDGAGRDDGESVPPGDVTGCSPKTGLMPELGDEVLLARVGDCRAEAAVGVCTTPSVLAEPGVCVRPKGSTPRGEEPLTPVVEDGVPVPPPWLSGREASSANPVAGKKAGLSLPYKARCWRASRSRRLSSFTAAGLMGRSGLVLPVISESRPLEDRSKLKPCSEMKSNGRTKERRWKQR